MSSPSDDAFAPFKGVILSPAERALLVEQCKGAKATLDLVIHHCENGKSSDIITAYAELIAPVDYINTVLHQKVQTAFLRQLLGDHTDADWET